MTKKNYLFVLLFLALGMILVSCGGKEESVDHYPQAIIKAMVENDTDKINELCAGEALKNCLRGAEEAQKSTIEITDLQVLEVSDTGADSKKIEFQFSYTEEKKGEEGPLRKREQKMFMNLKKVGSKWKIEKIDDTK